MRNCTHTEEGLFISTPTARPAPLCVADCQPAQRWPGQCSENVSLLLSCLKWTSQNRNEYLIHTQSTVLSIRWAFFRVGWVGVMYSGLHRHGGFIHPFIHSFFVIRSLPIHSFTHSFNTSWARTVAGIWSYSGNSNMFPVGNRRGWDGQQTQQNC